MGIFADVAVPRMWTVHETRVGLEKSLEHVFSVKRVVYDGPGVSVVHAYQDTGDYIVRVVQLPASVGRGIGPRMRMSDDIPTVNDVMTVVSRIDATGDIGVNMPPIAWEHITTTGIAFRCTDESGWYDVTVLPNTCAMLPASYDAAAFRSRLNACAMACLELASVGVVHRCIEPSVFMSDGDPDAVKMVCLSGAIIPTLLFLHRVESDQLAYAYAESTAYDDVVGDRWVVLKGDASGLDADMHVRTPTVCAIGNPVYAGWDQCATSRPSLRSMLESVGFCAWEWIFGDGCDTCLKWSKMDSDALVAKQYFTRCYAVSGTEIAPSVIRGNVLLMTCDDAVATMSPEQSAMVDMLSEFLSRVYRLDFNVNVVDRVHILI